jgi:ATP-binding cassette subfamily C protein LapB
VFVTAPQERPDEARFVAPVSGEGRLSFEAVSFRYLKDAAPVLDGVSFALERGDRAALVGGIGTGKSTILRLAQALREPQAGRVMLDGFPVSHLDPAILRGRIGLALQDGEIFSGTLRTNILLQLAAVDDALIEAARIAGALDWISRLPRGFDTHVGERGAGLSGGQRQTLLLARLIVRDPQVVLLDEPTSDLDPRTEQVVVEHLSRWLEGRTALIATHRPAMLALVDRLIVLEAGKIRFDGPKAGVLAAMAAANGLASAKSKGRPS